jgi:hypothetical protein
MIVESKSQIYIDTGAAFSHAGHLSAVVLNDKNGQVLEKFSVMNESLFDSDLRDLVQKRREAILKMRKKASS